ncbi:UNVERIFIED_CONTAM: Mitochondrial oxaloacetate carrier protein [Siphonaria sp. JEL0065]|nr:Mitochondrial oxaloacetate carrier protein [Siphonaria sp. JEL0065]
MEVVKTRLQLQGELEAKSGPTAHKRQYNGAISAFIKISRTEGVKGIQKGLAPAYLYQILMNGTRLGFYEPVRDIVIGGVDAIAGKGVGSTGFGKAVCMVSAGAGCGVLGAAIASPLYLVKTRYDCSIMWVIVDAFVSRMQSYSPNNAVGAHNSYVWGGLRKTLVHIYKNEGIAGLWRGADASMLRTGVGSAVQLSTYDASKQILLKSHLFDNTANANGGILLHFAASAFTSLFVCIAMNPFDVVSTRMYNQHRGERALYNSAFDCIAKTIKAEGPFALYKGFSAHYLRIG